MSKIKQALDALNEMTSGCVASVAMPLGATQQRENPSIYPTTSQVKEAEIEVEEEESPNDFGLWRNSALIGKEQKAKRQSAKKRVSEGIGPDKNDPWEKGWYAGHRPNAEDSYNPYEKGSAEYKRWQDGYDEAQAQPDHYNESADDIPDLEEVGEQIKSSMDAERRLSNGDRIFAFHEMDDEPHEIFNVDELKGYAPDRLLAVPGNLNEYDEGIQSKNPQGIPEGEDLAWDDPDLVMMRKMQAAKKKKMAVVKPKDEIGFRVADIGPGGREHNVKTDAAWDRKHGVKESVTDYEPKSQGGTRKELLAKLRSAKSAEEKSDLATRARKAGATQRELQGVTEADRNEMGTPEFRDALSRLKQRHGKDEWNIDKSRELAKKLAKRVSDPEKKISRMIDEVAPPDQEEWIKKNKARFIDQYGKEKGERILYATAWKRSKTNEASESHDFKVGQRAEYQTINKNHPPFPVIITAIDDEYIEFRSANGQPIPGTRETEWSADPGWKVLTPSRQSAESLDEKAQGLWANIHAKRKRIKAGSGERMRKPGSKGAPSNADLEASRTSESTDRDFDGEYNDEAGMARSNLHTIARAAEGLLDTIGDKENLPEWVQEKIAKVEGMMVSALNYLESQEEQGIDPKVSESFNLEEELQKLDDAKYQGRTVQLNKPMAGDVAKSKVYVKDPKTGNVKKVNFGQKGVKIKKNNPARRKSFRARHNCDNPGPKTKAKYWSCRAW